MVNSSSLATKIEKFRKLLVETERLSTVAEFFNAEMVDDGLFDISVPAVSKRISSFVTELVCSTCGEAQPVKSDLFSVPSYGLWHGFLAFPSGLVVQYAYADREERGYCVAARYDSGHCTYLRFSIPQNLPSSGKIQVVSATIRPKSPGAVN